MTLNNYIQNNNPEYIELKNMFPNFFNYVEKTYKNYSLAYSSEVFTDLLSGIILDNNLELKLIETTINEFVNQEFTPDKFGDTSKTSMDNIGYTVNSSGLDYAGYNVDNTFNKSKMINDATNNTNSNTQNINWVAFFGTINNFEFKSNWKKVNSAFKRLLITIYNL